MSKARKPWPGPKTSEEWRDAVDMADALLMLASCRMYGVVDGGPKINLTRCEELVEQGKARGIKPRPDAFERLYAALTTAN